MAQPRILDASSVVLVRELDGQRELFWVRRSREVSLGGGFYAFPGGRVDAADLELARALNLSPEEGRLRIAAVRELFEETGVFLTDAAIPAEALVHARKGLLSSELTLPKALEYLGRPTLNLGALHEAGRWLTPPYVPVRFDARFFVAAVPSDQKPEVWPGELVDGEWISPDQALARWRAARALLHPPALHLIRSVKALPVPESLPMMREPPHLVDYVAQRIEFQQSVHLFPVRTPTIPPATHTNCNIVGEEELVVIDPASPYEEEQEALAAFCEGLRAEGRRFREILLTHHHHDHVSGVQHLRERLGVPVRAHAATADLLRDDIPVDATIEDEEVIALPGDLRLRAVFTPGHAPGHLCFFEERTGSLFTGDMIAGIGSIVVNPPEGDMLQYMSSLRRLRSLPVGALHPAHGPTIPDGPRKIDEYIAHRQEREQQIESALRKVGTASAEELVPHVYTDVPQAMYPLAARSLIAVLEKLQKEGRAITDAQDRFTLS
jgi:glyoxylase-like metal-dependent hydrolase (beta-lactamase superfamily II)/8-oxo-dGTP pyrophosphatase MutT (NUDIX family)